MKAPAWVEDARAHPSSLRAYELPWASQILARARAIAVGLALAALTAALLLRLYGLDGFITYYPDTYAQLRAVDNLLAGEFPISYIYPPGIATALAPVFLILPDTLAAMQVAVVLAGVALIGLAYIIGRAWTGERSVGVLFAIAVAFGAPFVFFSRVLWFDGINTLLIASALFLAPRVKACGTGSLVGYGALVFAAVTVRYTNAIILPAVFLATLSTSPDASLVTTIRRHLCSRFIVTLGTVIAVLYGAYVLSAWESLWRFSSPHAGSVVGLDGYAERAGRYIMASLTGSGTGLGTTDLFAALAVAALAAGGARRLWLRNRSVTLALVALLLLWGPSHAAYIVFDARYALPAFFFVLFLAAYSLAGATTCIRSLGKPVYRVTTVTFLSLGLAFFAGNQLAHDISYLLTWPDQIDQSREPAYEEIRAALRGLDGERTVVISSQALAIDRANPEISTYDLIPHSGRYGINEDSVYRLLDYVREQQADGKTVYYHYTEYEDVRSRFRIYELGFDAYFSAIQNMYEVTEIVSVKDRAQRLYELQPPAATLE